LRYKESLRWPGFGSAGLLIVFNCQSPFSGGFCAIVSCKRALHDRQNTFASLQKYFVWQTMDLLHITMTLCNITITLCNITITNFHVTSAISQRVFPHVWLQKIFA